MTIVPPVGMQPGQAGWLFTRRRSHPGLGWPRCASL